MSNLSKPNHLFIVEHLDPELEDWQALEYNCIHSECSTTGSSFLLSGLTSSFTSASQLQVPPTSRSMSTVETLYPTPESRRRVCLLDPKAAEDLSPSDGDAFDVFLFGGILGDDPPRDRTGDLRKLGFPGRRLGPEQMTTDTAVRVTRMVAQGRHELRQIPYVDRPDIPILMNQGEGDQQASESVSMPFKYVKDKDGKPVLPPGMLELLATDADKNILDLL